MGRKKREEELIEVWDSTTMFVGFPYQRLLPSGQRMLGVLPMMGEEAQLVLSFPLPVIGPNRIANCWHYPTIEQAVSAYQCWPANAGEEQYDPGGWCWHPPTGRYRLGCNPGREYVLSSDERESRRDGAIDARRRKVARAVQVTLGEGWQVEDILERSSPVDLYEDIREKLHPVFFQSLIEQKVFRKCTYPPKTRFFLVWVCKGEKGKKVLAVYHALDRSVVIEQEHLAFLSLEQILERLTGDACVRYT